MLRFEFRGLMTACTLAVAASLPDPALAQAGNVINYFELDGNVKQDGTTKDDWQTINSGGSSYLAAPLVLIKRTGVMDDPAPKSIFTGGGSKDPQNLSSWKWKDGSVPDKDDITNAYAAAYNILGDLVIYAGADRFDNHGDAFMGFWFFKSAVSATPDGKFSGLHTPGDVLVLANFTGGGSTVTIQVYEWTASGTLSLIAGDAVNPANCGGSISPDYCGIANTVNGVPTYWPYTNKDGQNTYAAAEFLEVGINISNLLRKVGDNAAPCFSAFMAETRSSSSVTATLKDFVLGGFDVCGVQITKTCDSGAVNGDGASIDYAFSGKITNTGFGALTNMVLTDTPQAAVPPATVSSDYTFYDCVTGAVLASGSDTYAGPLAPGADACYRSTFNTVINGSTNLIEVVANTGQTTTTSDKSDTATCPPLTFDTGLTMTKDCVASLVSNGSNLLVKVDVSGSVCNQGNLGVTSLQVIDIVAGLADAFLTPSRTSLDAKGGSNECATYAGFYYPIAPDAGTTTQFSDAAKSKAVPPPITGKSEVTAGPEGATCDLCPTGVCTTANGTRIDKLLRPKTPKK